MRIERIRSLKDVALWCVDQVAHALIALLPAWLAWVACRGRGVPFDGEVAVLCLFVGLALLMYRERLQWGSKDRSDMTELHLIDPVLNVVVGASLAAVVLRWMMA